MINLLYTVIILEATTTLLLSFKTPLRKLTVTQLDNIKRGRGPIVLKTLSATVLLVFASSLYNVFKFTRRRSGSGGGVGVVGAAPPLQLNPADQLLFAKYLLESTLIENQKLRNQLKILDRRVSRSAVKKDS